MTVFTYHIPLPQARNGASNITLVHPSALGEEGGLDIILRPVVTISLPQDEQQYPEIRT